MPPWRSGLLAPTRVKVGLVGPDVNGSSCLNLIVRMYHNGSPRAAAELVSLSLAALSCCLLGCLYANTSQAYNQRLYLSLGGSGGELVLEDVRTA